MTFVLSQCNSHCCCSGNLILGDLIMFCKTPNSCSESPGLDPQPDLGCRFFCAQIEAEV
jgi:hypothetical protein